MSEVTYYFNSKSTSVWTDSAKMIDNILINYATTVTTADTETLDGNSCVGSDLGVVSKVEIRAYAYGDGGDRIDLTPVFTGGDGYTHQTTPKLDSPGDWGTYQDITFDINTPHTACDSGGAIVTSIYGVKWFAQTFITGKTSNITSVKIKVKRVNSPGTVTVSIKAVAGGLPTGNDLTSGTFDGDAIDINWEWKEVNLTSYELTEGTTYALVVRATAGDASNYFYWAFDSTAPYKNGSRIDSGDSGVNWTADESDDFQFQIYNFPWSGIQNLDCKVKYTKDGKANTMYCAKVEVRVTYTPSAAAAARTHAYIFG